jgi:muconolactone D-isomerase
MEFLVTFTVSFPEGTAEATIQELGRAEADAAAKLARDGNLVRLWKPPAGAGDAVGLYRAPSEEDLGELLAALPLYDWMTISIMPLEPHPNDPPAG